MLDSASRLIGTQAHCLDGDVGKVTDALFDDRSWTLRYLVVDAGTWLKGRSVLISPCSVKQPPSVDGKLHLSLTQDQLRHSPPLDSHQSVTRQHERELLRHYNYPEYWWGANLWGGSAFPYPPLQPEPATDPDREARECDFQPADRRLRSSEAVTGYSIHASDATIGTVQDFVFDDHNWTVRYVVVDTRSWWPGGRKVLVGVHWLSRIDWASKTLFVEMTRAQVKASPEFEDVRSIHRDDETRLHANHGREGYWL